MNDERLSLEITLRFVFKIIKRNLSNKIAIVFYLISFGSIKTITYFFFFRKFSDTSQYNLLNIGALYIIHCNIQYTLHNRK